MRKITLEGAINARSLEGMKSAYGTIRPNKLIRTGHLHGLSDSDVELLKQEGLQVVIDLRTPGEHDEKPDRQMEGVENIHLPIFDNAVMGITHEREQDPLIRMSKAPDLGVVYHKIVGPEAIEMWKQIFDVFDKYRNGTISWHCSAGKDRCGMTAYMIEYILGVDEQTRINDYLQSNEDFEPRAEKLRQQALERGLSEEDALNIKRMLMVDEDYLRSAISFINENYGSIDGFLLKCGVDEQYKERLREAFLE